jgi:hypothetical protein
MGAAGGKLLAVGASDGAIWKRQKPTKRIEGLLLITIPVRKSRRHSPDAIKFKHRLSQDHFRGIVLNSNRYSKPKILANRTHAANSSSPQEVPGKVALVKWARPAAFYKMNWK